MDSPNSDFSLSTEEKDAEIRRLTKIVDELRQEVYELRSRLQIAERCSHDYEAELEALQQDAIEKDNLHAAAIREIQEEKFTALKDAEEKIETWEVECQQMADKVTCLQKELEAKSLNSEAVSNERDERVALQTELEEALDALTASTAACEQHKELVSVLQVEKKDLAQRVEFLEQELELYKEHLSVSKSQLSAQTEDFKELQEQLAVTQSELATLKAAPDVQARGNSLFAEVEDNRQQMVKQYKMMLVRFNHMKNDYSAKCSEATKLKKEKSLLLDKLEIAEKEARKYYKGFVENYEIRIKELQMTINDLKNDVKPVYLNGNEEILKFAEHTMVNSRKEILNLREEMEMRSALRLNEAAELLKTRGELAQARTDLRKCSLKVKELTNALNGQRISGKTNLPREPTSSEEEPFETKSPAKLKLATSQKPQEVLITDELLLFNPRKRIEKKSVCEYPVNSEIRRTDMCTNLAMACQENSQDNMEQVKSDEMDRSSNAANLADESGLKNKLETDLDGVKVGDAPTVSEETCEDFQNCVQEESVVREEKLCNDVPFFYEDEKSPAATSLVCSSSEMETKDYLNSSPRFSNTASCFAERSPNPVNVTPCEVSVVEINSPPESNEESLRFDSSKSEQMCRSILKVRPDFSAFENTIEMAKKEVRFDQETSKVELDKENTGGIGFVKVEENKVNCKKNDGEENKRGRRRPRPKQNHPIIYMT